MAKAKYVDDHDIEEKRPKHTELVEAAIKDGGFCLVDGTPCIRGDGEFKFGWNSVERFMLEYDPDCVHRTRKEACQTLALVGPEVKQAPTKYIAFSDVVLDWESMQTYTYDEFDALDIGIIPVTIPHIYDTPAERDEAVETLLDGISCNDPSTRANLEEFAGLAMSREAGDHTPVTWGDGPGGNGKSTYYSLLEYLVGENNTSTLQLHDFDKQFNTTMLLGKLLNVSDDERADSVGKEVISFVKRVTTGQRTKIEPKGVNPYSAKLFCSFLVFSNEPPRLSDTSFGSMRRWHVVPMTANFINDEKRDPKLREKLHTEHAARWMIKLAIDGLRRVVRNGHMTDNERSSKALQEMKERSNSVYSFLAGHPKDDFVSYPNVEVWYWRYQEYAKQNGMKPFDQSRFSQFVCAEYGFTTANNGRYKEGDPEIGKINGLAWDHGKRPGDKFRIFVLK